MPEKSHMEHIPLSKQRLLEFLGAQKGPVTAKVASIDLDVRASTVTEMLERCAAQGLVEREVNQRPREYAITAAGRQRVGAFLPGENKFQRESVDAETHAIPSEGSKKIRVLIGRLTKLQEPEAEREDTPDPADEAKAGAESEDVRNLYHGNYELRSLGFFHSKTEVRARIGKLESAIGKEAAERVDRLVSLESQIRSESGTQVLQAVLELREVLHLPASVFGTPPKGWDTRSEKNR